MKALFVQILFFFSCLILFTQCKLESQNNFNTDNFQQEYVQKDHQNEIIPGAERTAMYVKDLQNKKVGIVANQSSRVGNDHLIDTLLELGIDIKKVFTPEHGFKGNADAGEKVKDGFYANEIPLVSLYGKNKKPADSDISDLDIVVFDLQDVGARFYTYISTLHYIMESCADNGKKLIVLDRPNPNGFYVDGPVLEEDKKSFVGMHPVPVVYGMSIGEYAKMINGEGWLDNKVICDLEVITCNQYDHTMTYDLPVAPSPNLPNLKSILLYPSLCLFEGTDLSIGRGTTDQFQVIGHPSLSDMDYTFTPVSRSGAKYPKHENKLCYGQSFSGLTIDDLKKKAFFDIGFVLKYYQLFENKSEFFKADFFDLLVGSEKLRNQIIDGLSEEEIRNSWQRGLQEFMEVRRKYLLYDDFKI